MVPRYRLKYVSRNGSLNRGFTGTKCIWVIHKGWLQLDSFVIALKMDGGHCVPGAATGMDSFDSGPGNDSSPAWAQG